MDVTQRAAERIKIIMKLEAIFEEAIEMGIEDLDDCIKAARLYVEETDDRD
jgi:hypothetical protein